MPNIKSSKKDVISSKPLGCNLLRLWGLPRQCAHWLAMTFFETL